MPIHLRLLKLESLFCGDIEAAEFRPLLPIGYIVARHTGRVFVSCDRSVMVLDEVGYVPLADIGAEFLFQVIAERAERATLIVTTNLPFSEWTQVFPNPRLCKALLDRITDRAHIIETGAESYRFRRTLEVRQKKRAS